MRKITFEKAIIELKAGKKIYTLDNTNNDPESIDSYSYYIMEDKIIFKYYDKMNFISVGETLDNHQTFYLNESEIFELEVGKTYEMRNGKSVCMFHTDFRSTKPYIGIYDTYTKRAWYGDGQFSKTEDHELDIIGIWVDKFRIDEPGCYLSNKGQKVFIVTQDGNEWLGMFEGSKKINKFLYDGRGNHCDNIVQRYEGE